MASHRPAASQPGRVKQRFQSLQPDPYRHETGNLDDWGTTTALLHLARTGKPVLGLGEGGYAFFGKRGLRIGYPGGSTQTCMISSF